MLLKLDIQITFYIPTLEEARRSFEIAQNVKEFVLEKLGIKEDEIR